MLKQRTNKAFNPPIKVKSHNKYIELAKNFGTIAENYGVGLVAEMWSKVADVLPEDCTEADFTIWNKNITEAAKTMLLAAKVDNEINASGGMEARVVGGYTEEKN